MLRKSLLRVPRSSISARREIVTDWRNKPKMIPVTDAKKGEPNYFEQEALKLHPAPGYIDRLCEIWFDKMSSQRELTFKTEDKLLAVDLSKPETYLPTVDGTQPRLEYEHVEALKNAPESVKKIYSINFGERKDLTGKWERLLVEEVHQHPLDEDSLEAVVGRLTAQIRHLTHYLQLSAKKNLSVRLRITAAIDERKRVLAQLRTENAASFDAILNKLKIAYTVPPLPEDDPGEQRKSWVNHIIQRKVELIKEERLAKLRLELIDKKKKFLAEREQKLSALDEEEKKLQNEIQELDREDDDQGLTNIKPVGTYAGHTIDCISEINMNEWMYRPPPIRKPILMNEQLKKRFR